MEAVFKFNLDDKEDSEKHKRILKIIHNNGESIEKSIENLSETLDVISKAKDVIYFDQKEVTRYVLIEIVRETISDIYRIIR